MRVFCSSPSQTCRLTATAAFAGRLCDSSTVGGFGGELQEPSVKSSGMRTEVNRMGGSFGWRSLRLERLALGLGFRIVRGDLGDRLDRAALRGSVRVHSCPAE